MFFHTFKSQQIYFSTRKDLFYHKVHSFTSAALISQCMSSLSPVRTELQCWTIKVIYRSATLPFWNTEVHTPYSFLWCATSQLFHRLCENWSRLSPPFWQVLTGQISNGSSEANGMTVRRLWCIHTLRQSHEEIFKFLGSIVFVFVSFILLTVRLPPLFLTCLFSASVLATSEDYWSMIL